MTLAILRYFIAAYDTKVWSKIAKIKAYTRTQERIWFLQQQLLHS